MEQEVEKWIKDDEILSNLIGKIRRNSVDDRTAAEAAFHQVAELFGLPKLMTDVSKDDTGNEVENEVPAEKKLSVFEALSFVNYMQPDDNIFDNVMLALFIANVCEEIDINQIALQHFGSIESIPSRYFIFFFGKDIDARISFDNPGGTNSWTDSGAVGMMQIGL